MCPGEPPGLLGHGEPPRHLASLTRPTSGPCEPDPLKIDPLGQRQRDRLLNLIPVANPVLVLAPGGLVSVPDQKRAGDMVMVAYLRPAHPREG